MNDLNEVLTKQRALLNGMQSTDADYRLQSRLLFVLENIDVSGDHWRWRSKMGNDGTTPLCRYRSKAFEPVRRIIFERFVGSLGRSMVFRTCNEPRCVAAEHMRLSGEYSPRRPASGNANAIAAQILVAQRAVSALRDLGVTDVGAILGITGAAR